jgi:hypothetical protein
VSSAPAIPSRLVALSALLCLFLGLSASASARTDRTEGVRVSFASQRVVQGNDANLGVVVHPAGVRCSLAVRYADGSRQRGLPSVQAVGGRASWRWTVPITTKAGRATATASCGRAGRVKRRIMVVGQVIAPHITVLKRGWSVRANPYGGTSLSYGALLANDSSVYDALKVYVIVNFVMADNHLIGTTTTTLNGIQAGTQYALGGDLSFPGAAPVDRMEITVQVGGHQRSNMPMPALANIHVVPDPYDPGWVGSVEGELLNGQAALSLQSAQLSAIVLDEAGNILGGGTGYTYAPLPPATREVLKMTGGFRAIRVEHAVSALVSIQPSWSQAQP